jgi:hypothetical protein
MRDGAVLPILHLSGGGGVQETAKAIRSDDLVGWEGTLKSSRRTACLAPDR